MSFIPPRRGLILASGIIAFTIVSIGMEAHCLAQAPAAGEAGISIPGKPDLDIGEAVGLAAGIKPEVLTWERIYDLAIIRARSGDKYKLATRLDPNAIAARAKADNVADFDRFRREFSDPKNAFPDPTAHAFRLLQKINAVVQTHREIMALENMGSIFRQLAGGELGTTKAQSDRVEGALLNARGSLSDQIVALRETLDELKHKLGLVSDAQVVPDLSFLSAFHTVFVAADVWQADPNRKLADLDSFGARLPLLDDVVIEGRSILALTLTGIDRSEDLLAAADKIWVRRFDYNAAAIGIDSVLQNVQVRSFRALIRNLISTARKYEIERRQFVLTLRQRDGAFEQLIAPPPASDKAINGSVVVDDLLVRSHELNESRSRIVDLWAEYQSNRFALLRDLGDFPFKDWTSFYKALSPRPGQPPRISEPVTPERKAVGTPPLPSR